MPPKPPKSEHTANLAKMAAGYLREATTRKEDLLSLREGGHVEEALREEGRIDMLERLTPFLQAMLKELAGGRAGRPALGQLPSGEIDPRQRPTLLRVKRLCERTPPLSMARIADILNKEGHIGPSGGLWTISLVKRAKHQLYLLKDDDSKGIV